LSSGAEKKIREGTAHNLFLTPFESLSSLPFSIDTSFELKAAIGATDVLQVIFRKALHVAEEKLRI
jgi:hypothetical protein